MHSVLAFHLFAPVPLILDVWHSFIGSIEHNSHNGLMWNIALDGNGNPKLPGTSSCGTPCRPVATVNSDGSWSVNQECKFYQWRIQSVDLTRYMHGVSLFHGPCVQGDPSPRLRRSVGQAHRG